MNRIIIMSHRRSGEGSLPAILVSCLVAAYLFVVFYQNDLYIRTRLIETLMAASILLSIIISAFSIVWKKADPYKSAVICILAIGVIMRIGYMLYTPYSIRGHDLGSAGDCGHADYIGILMQGRLPDSNDYQFYHPPLFHALAAGASNLYGKLTGEQDAGRLLEAGKLISCWSSVITLFLSEKLIREMRLDKSGMVTAVAVSSFLPAHYLMAGRLNNDALSVMFMTAIILYTLKWLRTSALGDLIMLALCFGFGMMAKISVGLFALVTGPVMLFLLYRSIKMGNAGKCIIHYFLFALIAFPLGLWYPIRNLVRFSQPFNYIFPGDIAGPLYCGSHSLLSRFLPVPDAFIYADPTRDYNVWTYLIRTSVFGEFQYDIPRWIPASLLICAAILAISGLAAMILRLAGCRWGIGINHVRPDSAELPGCGAESITGDNRAVLQERILAGFWIVLTVSYLWFNLKFPFGCTMDFRYIVPSALIGGVFLGRWLESEGNSNAGKTSRRVLSGIVSIFSILSCVMYVMI